jgi:hypothetical protein
MIIKTNPEFGIELALTVPYAYWLHTQGQLKTVITSIGMRPFYYFCEDVREEFVNRTIDNAAAGLNELPNNWIHGIDSANNPGVLDYTKWMSPPYKEFYRNDEFKIDERTVFITNKFNIEHGHEPKGYFSIECLYEMFMYFKEIGYSVIYKRTTNQEQEFTLDQNEYNSLANGYTNILADVEGIGIINDFQLCNYFDNVTLLTDIIKTSPYSYNETQLKVMANCNKFISVCGGNAILSSLFGGTTLIYVHTGRELRPNYFGPESYFRKLSSANIVPVIDRTVMETGVHDYSELFSKIKECF